MHRTASVNEYSGRFSLMPMLFYMPEEEQFQLQSKSNKQGREGGVEKALYMNSRSMLYNGREQAQAIYKYMTDVEVAREIARIDLPLSTYTQWYWKIDLHNLMHFLKLRVDSHAQWEIQQYGKIMAGMFKAVAPLSYEAWIDYDVCGTKFSRRELDYLRKMISAEHIDDSLILRTQSDERVIEPNVGISKREMTELLSKLQPRKKPDFELDPIQAMSAEYFEKKMADAVPKESDE
jgi:thymidylate synthase (FAD)